MSHEIEAAQLHVVLQHITCLKALVDHLLRALREGREESVCELNESGLDGTHTHTDGEREGQRECVCATASPSTS